MQDRAVVEAVISGDADGFAAAHGGHVTVHSVPGTGTTLRLWIPGNARPGGLIDQA